MKRILTDVWFVAALAIVIVAALVMTGCTYATVTTSDGVAIRYIDAHPTGNAVELEADWEGVGSLRTKRSNEGAEKLIEAAVPIL